MQSLTKLLRYTASAASLALIILVSAAILANRSKAETSEDKASLTKSHPLRNAYFGELHLHTTFSFDAYVRGTRITPEEAYKFGRGETITYQGKQIRKKWPLDFMAVTDHAENIAVLNELDKQNSAFSKSEPGKRAIRNTPDDFWYLVRSVYAGNRWDTKASLTAWQQIIEAANTNYQPGTFTTFIAYEWSTNQAGKNNLHRNVIFREDTAPLPFSSMDSEKPEDLWTYLEANRKRGIEALAIPHNANKSGGLMYDWNDSDGRPIDRVYAQRRALNEPLSEIVQVKGQSDTHPVISPNDEFADFEIDEWTFAMPREKGAIHGSYIRDAFGRGLVLTDRVGANPYKFGVVGGSDSHTGLSDSDENVDTSWVAPPVHHRESGNYDLARIGSAGLAGVWAEQNTRESIYNALRRKETFATSGTRMKIRFFAGWDYEKKMMDDSNWPGIAYKGGVPMGGDLIAKTATPKAPRFVVWALKDPNGANLDRAQIIKVWLAGDSYKEKIFDVACSGSRRIDPVSGRLLPVGDTVDLTMVTYKNTIGATELRAVWDDPEFEPQVPAVYYLRVLEIPTPRWNTFQSMEVKRSVPPDAPATIQEHGWSSPIWYTPRK